MTWGYIEKFFLFFVFKFHFLVQFLLKTLFPRYTCMHCYISVDQDQGAVSHRIDF